MKTFVVAALILIGVVTAWQTIVAVQRQNAIKTATTAISRLKGESAGSWFEATWTLHKSPYRYRLPETWRKEIVTALCARISALSREWESDKTLEELTDCFLEIFYFGKWNRIAKDVNYESVVKPAAIETLAVYWKVRAAKGDAYVSERFELSSVLAAFAKIPFLKDLFVSNYERAIAEGALTILDSRIILDCVAGDIELGYKIAPLVEKLRSLAKVRLSSADTKESKCARQLLELIDTEWPRRDAVGRSEQRD